jgi:hypothetical protein
MKQLPKDFLTIGRGAEYIVRGDDVIVLVSSGRKLVIETRLTDKAISNVVLRDPSRLEPETIIFSGTAAQSLQAWIDIGDQLTNRKRPPFLSIIRSLSVTVASIAVVAALAVGYLETRRASAEMGATGTAVLDSPKIPGDLRQAGPVVSAPDQGSLRVLKKPDFLDTPTQLPENPKNLGQGASEGAPAATASETISDIGLPAYNPDLYSGAPAKAHEAAPVVTKPKLAAVEGKETDTTADASKATEASAPVKQANSPVSVTKDPQEGNVGASEKPKSSNDAAEEAKPSKGADAKPVSNEAITKNAQAAIKKLIGDGMSDADVRKLLLSIQQLNTHGDEGITPDMLKALPEEVAALLADQGMELDGPGSGSMNILPSEVVDQFRGKDGVATIPENYSWYARSGGPVSIPLPGGGDIKRPDDLKDFGLAP